MTAQELAKRNEKAQQLRVIQVDDTWFYVESDEGKICYKVCYAVDGKENYCTCGDFAKGAKADPLFKCKHLLAVINCLPAGDIGNAHYLERAKPKLDERFIITVEGQDFCKYAGLLDLAHQKKLTKLDVEILQYPTQENEKTAICKAHALTVTGDIFGDVGDANPFNCNAKVSKHIIRMASTRAKARTLRDLTNIGMTCLEELGDLDEVIGKEEKGTAQKGKLKPFPKQSAKTETEKSTPGNGHSPETKASTEGNNGTDHAIDIGLAAPEKNAGNNNGNGSGVKEPTKETQKETGTAAQTAQPGAKSTEKSGGNGQDKGKAETAQKSGGNGQDKGKTDPPPKMSEAQKRAIYNLSRRRGISVEQLEKMSQDSYKVPVEMLNPSDASSFIRNLQQSA